MGNSKRYLHLVGNGAASYIIVVMELYHCLPYDFFAWVWEARMAAHFKGEYTNREQREDITLILSGQFGSVLSVVSDTERKNASFRQQKRSDSFT